MTAGLAEPHARTAHGPEAQALASCPVPVALADRAGALIALSPAAARLMGGPDAAAARAEVAAAAGRLIAAGGAEAEAVALAAGDDGQARVLEVTLLPFGVPGRHLLHLRDVTLERNLRAALTESRQRYKDLVEASSDFAWEVGADGRFVMVSAAGALGYGPAELVGARPAAFVLDPPESGPLLPFETAEPLDGYELWFRDAAGRPACLAAACVPLFDEAGAWRGARGVCRDLTATRRRDAELAAARNRERLLAYAVRAIGDVADPAAMLPTAASAAARVLDAAGAVIYRRRDGLVPAASAGDVPAAALAEAGDGERIVEAAADGGRWIAVATRFRGEVNGAIAAWRPDDAPAWTADERGLLADLAGHVAVVMEQAAQHEELERLSATDPLTGLANRRAFLAALEGRLAAARAGDRRPGALVYVDLDNFKQVNDVSGHQRGDEALVAVAGILAAAARPADLLARLGGDEFALWLEGCGAAQAPERAAALVAAAGGLAGFTPPGGRSLGFSVGVALFEPDTGETLAGLVARADAVMYEVKRHGKGRYGIAPAAGSAG